MPTEPCLGAIIFPNGEASTKYWCFRVIGNEYEVDRLKPEFEAFVRSVSFSDNEQIAMPTPKGWKEKEKDEKQALPTLMAGKLEIAVFRE